MRTALLHRLILTVTLTWTLAAGVRAEDGVLRLRVVDPAHKPVAGVTMYIVNCVPKGRLEGKYLVAECIFIHVEAHVAVSEEIGVGGKVEEI